MFKDLKSRFVQVCQKFFATFDVICHVYLMEIAKIYR